MNNNEIYSCNLPILNSADEPECIKRIESNVLAPMTQNQVREMLIKFFNEGRCDHFNQLGPNEKAITIFNYIYNKENRPRISREYIKKLRGHIKTTE